MLQLFCQSNEAIGVRVFALCAKSKGCVNVNPAVPVRLVVATPPPGTPSDGTESG
jgi:hypothetical protein